VQQQHYVVGASNVTGSPMKKVACIEQNRFNTFLTTHHTYINSSFQNAKLTLFLKPDCQQSEYSGTTHGSKEPTPIVPHCEVHCGDLYAEQHTCNIIQEHVPHIHFVQPAGVKVDMVKP